MLPITKNLFISEVMKEFMKFVVLDVSKSTNGLLTNGIIHPLDVGRTRFFILRRETIRITASRGFAQLPGVPQ